MWKTLFVFLIVFLPIGSVFATDLSGYAWSSNIGWIRFSGPGYGVALNDATGDLSGHAWSSNIGWVEFLGDQAKVLAWDGLIKLHGPNYDVVNDTNSCQLKGWAWGSDTIGWVHFSGPGYSVRYEGANCAPANPPSCTFSASPARVAKGGRATLSWNCNGTADSCSIATLGLINGPQASSISTGPLLRTTQFSLECFNASDSALFNTQVRVVRPKYCEVIPFLSECQ